MSGHDSNELFQPISIKVMVAIAIAVFLVKYTMWGCHIDQVE
jgi:hypothetical protein